MEQAVETLRQLEKEERSFKTFKSKKRRASWRFHVDC